MNKKSEWFCGPRKKSMTGSVSRWSCFNHTRLRESLREARKSPDSNESSRAAIKRERNVRHNQSHTFRELQLERGQGGRWRLVCWQAHGIFEGTGGSSGCLVGGKQQSTGWFEYRRQNNFLDQEARVRGVARVGALGIAVELSSSSGLGGEREGEESIFFHRTKGPGEDGC